MGATQYQWQIDDTSDLSSPISTQTRTVTNYTAPGALGLEYGHTYYWHVRAGNAANIWSNWSPIFRFTLTVHATPANATFLTTNKPSFAWAAATGTGVLYALQIADNSNFTGFQTLYSGPNRTYVMPDPGLLTLGQYYWRVCINGTATCMQPWTFTITITPPIAPLLVAPPTNAYLGDNTPDFSWYPLSPTVPGGPFEYQIQIDNVNTFANPAVDVRQSSTAYTPLQTLSDGVYFWRVRAINSVDTTGTWSLPRAFTIDTTAPAAPVLTAPADRSASTLTRPTFTWAASVGATQYRFYLSTDCATFIPVAGPQTTLFFVPAAGLLIAKADPYCWQVQAGDRAGNWSSTLASNRLIVSATAIARPGTPVLAAPPINNFTNNPRPLLSWTMPLGVDITTLYFEVQLDDIATFVSPLPLGVTPVNTLNYTPGSDLADGRYYWRARAVNPQGVAGLWSTARYFTIDTVAPAVPVLTAPANGSISVITQRPTFTWGAVPGATQYQVMVDDNSNFGSTIANATPTTASYLLTTNLTYGTLYYWQVRAKDAAGNYSNWTSVYTFTPTVHRAPANNANTAATRPTFTWQTVVGGIYVLKIDDNADCASPLRTHNPTVSPYVLPLPALAHGTYYWRIRSMVCRCPPGRCM